MITSQASLDPYQSTKTLLTLNLGPQRRVDKVEIKREAPDGAARLQMRRSKGQAVISGTRPYYGPIAFREPVDDKILLGGPILSDDFPFDMMAAFLLAGETASEINQGQTAELRWKQLELNPGEFFRDAT